MFLDELGQLAAENRLPVKRVVLVLLFAGLFDHLLGDLHVLVIADSAPRQRSHFAAENIALLFRNRFAFQLVVNGCPKQLDELVRFRLGRFTNSEFFLILQNNVLQLAALLFRLSLLEHWLLLRDFVE